MNGVWRAAGMSALAAWVVGCGTTRYGGPRPTGEVEASLRAEYPRAPIDAIVSGSQLWPFDSRVPFVGVSPVTGAVIVKGAGGEEAVPDGRIRELRVRHRGRGAAIGAVTGLVAGGAFGASIFYVDTAGCAKVSEGCNGRGTGLMAATIFFGMLSALVGTGVGALFAPETTVRFGDPPRSNE